MSEDRVPYGKQNQPRKPYTGENYWGFKCGKCGAPGKYIELEQVTCGMFVSAYNYKCTLCDHEDGVRFSE